MRLGSFLARQQLHRTTTFRAIMLCGIVILVFVGWLLWQVLTSVPGPVRLELRRALHEFRCAKGRWPSSLNELLSILDPGNREMIEPFLGRGSVFRFTHRDIYSCSFNYGWVNRFGVMTQTEVTVDLRVHPCYYDPK